MIFCAISELDLERSWMKTNNCFNNIALDLLSIPTHVCVNNMKRYLKIIWTLTGGAVVYWIEPLTLNQRVPGSIPVRTSALLSFSKALYPHCCSPPRCINGYLVGCEWDYVSYCLSPFYRLTLWKLPRELRLRTISAVLNSIHWPG